MKEEQKEFLILNKAKKPLFHITLDSLLKSPMVYGSSNRFREQLLMKISLMDKGDIIQVDFENNHRWDALIEDNSHIYLQKVNE